MVEMIGPYRVHDRLGVGGMGEVYKAYDERLDRWVAIKRIRPDRLDSEDNRERFKREARATAKLNHPSIVHLYGIFQEDESDCIVMEYVEGQTLDRLLADGPLDAYRVASLGYEISSGLAEAHTNGILHRDLKAENIIITAKGRAKILDFGLAKPLLDQELDPMLTGKGQLVGTSRAMSPEYVGGDAIDHRSDLFSLGVLLYECATGKSPFKAHNTLATLKQVMLHRQTPVHEINSDVPASMSALVDRLLAKEPDKRPQSAEDVTVEFGQILSQMSSATIDLPGGGFARSSTSGTADGSSPLRNFSASDTVLDLRAPRRWVPIVSILAVLVVGAFMLGYFLQQPKRQSLADGEVIQIVLGEFENNTSDPQFEKTLAQAFRVGLEQSRAIQALPPSQIRDALRRMERAVDTRLDRDVAVEIARRENAEGVVLGGIAQIGKQFVVTADVLDPVKETSWYTTKETAEDEDQVLSAVDTLTRDIREFLGESREAIQRDTRPLEKVTTANLDALDAYTAGVEKLEAGASEESIQFFLRAIDLDPGFAMAHAKLVVIFSNEGNREEAEKYVDLALEQAERLTDVERFYVEGWAARWRGSPEDVLRVWSLMSEFYPENFAARYNLGLSYWFYMMDFDAAAMAFSEALEVATRGVERQNCHWFLGYSALAAGDFVTAKQHFGQLEEKDQAHARFDLLRAELRFREAADLAKGRSEPEWLVKRALLGLDQGDALSASSELDLALEKLDLSSARRPADLALQALLGAIVLDLPEQRAVKRVYSLAPFPDDGKPQSSIVSFLATAGKVEARRGRVSEATDLLSRVSNPPLQASRITRAFIAMLEAEIKMANGENLDRTAKLMESLLSEMDFWQVRETYYRVLQELGWHELALEQRQILLSKRPLAVVECVDQCFSQAEAASLWGKLAQQGEP